MRLFYRTWGETGIPILMLHGHPGNSACMEVLAQALADQAQIIAPDLRGYGRSRTQRSFVMEDHLSDLQALITDLGWGQFGIIGWSLGGILALELARLYPTQVVGVGLIASAARPRGAHPPVAWWEEVNTAIASLLNALSPGHPWVINPWGHASLYRYLIRQHTASTYRHLAAYVLPAYFQTSAAAHRALNQRLSIGYDQRAILSDISVPTVVMAGEVDVHITAMSSYETAQDLPNATWIEYKQVAHLFPWEIPEQVQRDLRHWWIEFVLPGIPSVAS